MATTEELFYTGPHGSFLLNTGPIEVKLSLNHHQGLLSKLNNSRRWNNLTDATMNKT